MKKLKFYPTIEVFNIDFMKHVSNIAYIQWMEIGRCQLLAEVGLSVLDTVNNGMGPVLTSTEIRYRHPLYLGDTVRGEIWISEQGSNYAWMSIMFYNQDDTLVASARQRGMFLDLTTGKPMNFNQDLLDRFSPYFSTNEADNYSS